MSEWNFPKIIELADGTKCVRLEDFLKNEGYKELYEVAKRKIERLRERERDEAIRALTNIAALLDHNVVRARKIAQEALKHLEAAK